MKHLKILAVLCLTGFALSACAPTKENGTQGDPIEAKPTAETPATPEPMAEAPAEASAPVATPAANPAPAAPPAPTINAAPVEIEWLPLFNGENLEGLTQRGAATWEVKDGVLTGQSPDGQGHIYFAPELTDLEVKGMFKITALDRDANSGLYFRANPPEDNVDGYPKGYEAQICHSQDAHTGWLWKPGAPTGKANKLLTKDGEWFSMRVKAQGKTIQIWVEDELVMTYQDEEYTKGYFALQCHNAGMIAEAKDLYYRDLSAQ